MTLWDEIADFLEWERLDAAWRKAKQELYAVAPVIREPDWSQRQAAHVNDLGTERQWAWRKVERLFDAEPPHEG